MTALLVVLYSARVARDPRAHPATLATLEGRMPALSDVVLDSNTVETFHANGSRLQVRDGAQTR